MRSTLVPPPSLHRAGVCRPKCDARSVPGTFDYTWIDPLTTIEAVQKHIREWGGVLTRMSLPQKELREWFQTNPGGGWRQPGLCVCGGAGDMRALLVGWAMGQLLCKPDP